MYKKKKQNTDSDLIHDELTEQTLNTQWKEVHKNVRNETKRDGDEFEATESVAFLPKLVIPDHDL